MVARNSGGSAGVLSFTIKMAAMMPAKLTVPMNRINPGIHLIYCRWYCHCKNAMVIAEMKKPEAAIFNPAMKRI